MDPKSDLYGSCARGFGAASLFPVTSQSVSVTMALRLPGQGRLQGSQVDTAAESEPKISSNVRGNFFRGWVWSQEGGRVALSGVMISTRITRKECLWSPLPKCYEPTQREERWAKPEHRPGTPSRELGVPDQESNPRFVLCSHPSGIPWLCTGNQSTFFSVWALRACALLWLLFCMTNTKPTVSEITCFACF